MTDASPAPATNGKQQPQAAKRTWKCGICGEYGHNRRTCPNDRAGAEPEDTAPEPDGPSQDEVVAEALANAEKTGSLSVEDVLKVEKRVIAAWDSWRATLREHREVSKQTKDAAAAAEAKFREVVETGHKRDTAEPKLIRHLRKIQKEWQDWREVVAQGVEQRKGARADVTAAAKLLERRIENARQLELPGMAA